jgi:hypothetical protein
LSLSGVGLAVEEAPALVEQLGKFPAIQQLDVSANPGLRCGGAAAVLSALSGMLHSGALFFFSGIKSDADVQGLLRLVFIF